MPFIKDRFLISFRDSVLAFKCVKELDPGYLVDRFKKRLTIHAINTRNKDKLNILAYKSASGQRTFLYHAG